MRKAKDVDEYIASAPKEARSKLKEMRKIIKEVARDSVRPASGFVQIPHYSLIRFRTAPL